MLLGHLTCWLARSSAFHAIKMPWRACLLAGLAPLVDECREITAMDQGRAASVDDRKAQLDPIADRVLVSFQPARGFVDRVGEMDLDEPWIDPVSRHKLTMRPARSGGGHPRPAMP